MGNKKPAGQDCHDGLGSGARGRYSIGRKKARSGRAVGDVLICFMQAPSHSSCECVGCLDHVVLGLRSLARRLDWQAEAQVAELAVASVA